MKVLTRGLLAACSLVSLSWASPTGQGWPQHHGHESHRQPHYEPHHGPPHEYPHRPPHEPHHGPPRRPHHGPPNHNYPHNHNNNPGQSSCPYPRQTGPDYDYTSYPCDQNARVAYIIDQFRFAWNGYYTYAFPHDNLLPKNNSFEDTRNGWALTAIDSLDTAILMEQTDIVQQIMDYVPSIDFTMNQAQPPDAVSTSLFETNIRYLGGLLGAYDLLKGPFAHLGIAGDKVEALLTQAVSLADTLKFAFDTPTGVPVNQIFIDNQTFTPNNLMADGSYWADLAEFGTLVLEWQHLSDLTGDPQYGDLAQKAEAVWFNDPGIYPGLTSGNFSVGTGNPLDPYGGWTGGNDSAYEYLLKMYVYDPDRYQNYSARWQQAAESTLANLLGHPTTRPDLTVIQAFAGMHPENYSQQLACFTGGNFILGSTVLNRPELLDYGLQFSEWCANGYRYAASGVGPSIYSFNTSILAQPQYQNQTALYDKAGWFIPDNLSLGNGQVPEAVESWYYAYQVTHDQYWRDVAWSYTLAQDRVLRVGSGYSNVKNVLAPDGDGNENFMASFMLAETLKYSFLIQNPKKGVWDVEFGEGNKNFFVYNTEAHPLRVAAKRPV